MTTTPPSPEDEPNSPPAPSAVDTVGGDTAGVGHARAAKTAEVRTARAAKTAEVRTAPAATTVVVEEAPPSEVSERMTAPSPPPRPRPAPAPVSPADHREQFLRAYLRHRVGDRLAAFEHARTRYARALRWTTAATVLLYTSAAALGAVAVADPGRRAVWGFLATVAAALATAVTVYESAFSFRALARRSAAGVALLHLLQAHGAPEGQDGVDAFRTEVESVLRHAE